MSAIEAKEASELAANQPSAEQAATNLAGATAGTVVKPERRTSSDMDCPDSPKDLARQWCLSQLDQMPEGSVISVPVELYREMVLNQFHAEDMIQAARSLIEDHVQND